MAPKRQSQGSTSSSSKKRKSDITSSITEHNETRASVQKELFGITGAEFTDCLVNAINDFICDGVDAIETELKKTPKLSHHQRKIEQCADNLLEYLSRQVDFNFDKFELYVERNIFPTPVDEPSEEALDEELLSTRRELTAVCRELANVQRQRAVLQTHISLVKDALRLVNLAVSSEGNESLDSQMTELREISSHLKLVYDETCDASAHIMQSEQLGSEGVVTSALSRAQKSITTGNLKSLKKVLKR